MIPTKIEENFIQVTTNFSGIITEIIAGKFASQEFSINDSIYKTCPFLEATLDAVPINDSFHIDSMFITSLSKEFNIDVEIFKDKHSISVIIINRTNVYKYVKQLNQNRNEVLIIKNKLDRQNKELEKLRKIADRANEEKSRFLAVMSHEVRNPLNSILGYADMIASETSNPIVKDYVKYLLMAGENLKVIVGDILNLSRIEAGKLELIIKPISIAEIVQTRVKNFNIKHRESNVQLNFLLSDKLPKQVLGDSVRIAQILSNLINNSFKFTEKGNITVKAELFSEKKEAVTINFSVKDTGRGMLPEQAAKIFKEYEQTELDDSRIHDGVGLGLSIVKRLVEAMEGKIVVESELNIGTTFIVQIPFKKVTTLKNIETTKPEQNFNLNNINILITDDDKLNQIIAERLLSKEGANTAIANDGLEAIAQLKKQCFDVVLLDINMPNMSGEELMKEKAVFKEYNFKTPILALTANTSKEDTERYLALGFSSVISKPYNSVELMTAISTAIKK